MKNLAGDKHCDREIERELSRCGIDVVHGERSQHEVAATVTGRLGSFRFHRAWYYWVVSGPMPLKLARKLYADPVGKTDIRVTGHCACPAPEAPWVTYYDADGKQLIHDPEGKEEKSFAHFITKGFVTVEQIANKRFVPDAAAAAARAFVESYHVDSELGLYILANAIRSLGPFSCDRCSGSGVTGTGPELGTCGACRGSGVAEPTTEYGANLNKPVLSLYHSALLRLSTESYFKVFCPACGDGLLLVSRDQKTLALTNIDRCIRCAQQVRYLDAKIGGELVATDRSAGAPVVTNDKNEN